MNKNWKSAWSFSPLVLGERTVRCRQTAKYCKYTPVCKAPKQMDVEVISETLRGYTQPAFHWVPKDLHVIPSSGKAIFFFLIINSLSRFGVYLLTSCRCSGLNLVPRFSESILTTVPCWHEVRQFNFLQ